MSQAVTLVSSALQGVKNGRQINGAVLHDLYRAVDLINGSNRACIDLAASILQAESANKAQIEGVPLILLRCLLTGGLIHGE